MINVTPISIAAAAQSYAAELTEKLCQPYCVNASIQPVVDVTYTIDDTSLVGTTLYVTVKAQGSVNYVPKCGHPCNPKSKIFTEYFTVAFTGATAATTATLVQAAGIVKPAYVNCFNVACGISALNTVTITVA
jgi:hypothetical protein